MRAERARSGSPCSPNTSATARARDGGPPAVSPRRPRAARAPAQAGTAPAEAAPPARRWRGRATRAREIDERHPSSRKRPPPRTSRPMRRPARLDTRRPEASARPHAGVDEPSRPSKAAAANREYTVSTGQSTQRPRRVHALSGCCIGNARGVEVERRGLSRGYAGARRAAETVRRHGVRRRPPASRRERSGFPTVSQGENSAATRTEPGSLRLRSSNTSIRASTVSPNKTPRGVRVARCRITSGSTSAGAVAAGSWTGTVGWPGLRSPPCCPPRRRRRRARSGRPRRRAPGREGRRLSTISSPEDRLTREARQRTERRSAARSARRTR